MTQILSSKKGFIVVLIFGILFGYFVWKTYFTFLSHLYPLSFNEANWIVSSEANPHGYFRKELFIPEDVYSVWVKIAATDSFQLYINGRIVDKKLFNSLNVSGIYDLTKMLHSGKNVLGVAVRRRTYPGNPKLVVEGEYGDNYGHIHKFYSDRSWKVVSYEQNQFNGMINWYDVSFNDALWPFVKTAGVPQTNEIYPLDIYPDSIFRNVDGEWIRHPDPAVNLSTFERIIFLQDKADDAWIRLTSDGAYDLRINNIRVDYNENPKGILWLYNITPLLHAGNNTISIGVEKGFSGGVVLSDGFIIHGMDKLIFKTDSTWKVNAQAVNDREVSSEYETQVMPAFSLGKETTLVNPMRKIAREVVLSTDYQIKRYAIGCIIIVFVSLIITGIWIISSIILHYISHVSLDKIKSWFALLYLTPTIFLCFLILLRYDVRYDPSFPFYGRYIYITLALIIVLKVLLIIEVLYWYRDNGDRLSAKSVSTYFFIFKRREIFLLILLIILVSIGFLLRLYNLSKPSLFGDEMSMFEFAQGVLSKGFPHRMLGTILRPATTYELVPYPIAISTFLLGISDFSIRFPAVIFGTLTIVVIYIVGWQIFNRRVGIFAALVYTFTPMSIIWAQNAFHPQQAQLLALLTSYFFYQAIKEEVIKHKPLYIAVIFFILTYLSWEGTGFILPALICSLIAVKGKDISWLRDRHVWFAGGIASLSVIIQLTWRILNQVRYLALGTGLAEVSTPSLFFLDPMYDPWFYIENFLWYEHYIILTLILISGFPMIWKSKCLRFYYVLFFSLIIMMTNLLSNASIRYVHYLLPFFLISASAVIVSGIDSILSLKKWGSLWTIRLASISPMFFLPVIIILSTNDFVLKLYRINNFSNPGGMQSRRNIHWADNRSISEYLLAHTKDGDIVINGSTTPSKYYLGRESEYFIETYLSKMIFYDITQESVGYIDKNTSSVIRNLDELKDVLNKHNRVWINATPYHVYSLYNNNELVDFVDNNFKVVYESYGARLYLWEK